jgi:type VI secretion system secreted protein VgrG
MPPPITLSSPLPDDVLRFESMSATAGLSMLGEMQLGLLSPKADLKPEALLGKTVLVKVALPEGGTRHFHGHVTRFGLGASRGLYHGWQATVRPWLWFLTRTSDCRIFQEQTVPDIVKKVLQDHAIADFEFKLFRSYKPWVYCVQYRESDFNFIARLLEHEGIYWYFEHSDGAHKLILVDSASAHDPVPAPEALPYYENGGQRASALPIISNWSFSQEVRTGKVVLTSYDFERPSTSLQVENAKARSHELADYELFDFQGDYVQSADGSQWAEDRIDELQARFQLLHGSSDAYNLAVGHTVSMLNHPRDDQNAKYLITGLSVHAHVEGDQSGAGAGGFHCDFSAIPAEQQFRPSRRTPKPFVQGPQTALVVGPGGEEIFTDKYGRVKVQFHWDRYGKHDENSSCWVRVSHPWAGKGWGSISVPRIGQEVIVEFLEGDPDQPIITGRVYNGDSMPPFGLPGGAVVSGIKSNTHKGKGYNELTMDDTAGKEKITIHGQYDMNTTVEHDQTNTVNNDFTETIKNNAKISIVQGTYSHDVQANTAKYHVQGALTETYDATQTTKVKQAIAISSTSGPISISSDSQHVYINAGTNIQLHVGSSMIWMDSGGQINIQGVNVALNGSSSVVIKGGIVHSEAQSEHQTKGAIVLSEGSATNTVKGGMVMLNP